MYTSHNMDNEKLQTKHLAPYLQFRINPLLIQFGNGIYSLDGLQGAWGVDLRQGMAVTTNVNVQQLKPLLIPLVFITEEQWISIFLSGVDYEIDLADLHLHLSFDYAILYKGEYIIEVDDILNSDQLLFAYTFKEQAFTTYKSKRLIQRKAFEKLYELHADVDLLIQAGLALYKSQYL